MDKTYALAVVGHRDFNDGELFAREMHYIYTQILKFDKIIIGSSKWGVSRWARKYAKLHNIPIEIEPTPREGLGWMFSSHTICERCDMMVVFWDGKRDGRVHIELAFSAAKYQYGKQVRVVHY